MARRTKEPPFDATVQTEAVRIIGKMIAKLERMQGGESDLTREARSITGGEDLATRTLPVNEARERPLVAKGRLCTEGNHPAPGSPAIAVANGTGSSAFCVECLLRESAKGNRAAQKVRMIREDYNGDG